MIVAENALRMSPEAQDLYRTHQIITTRSRDDYLVVTDMLQMQIAERFFPLVQAHSNTNLQKLSTLELFDLLQNAPHLLGREASHLSNYIKGSFAAFPEKEALRVGEKVPQDVSIASDVDSLVPLVSLVKNNSAPWTILFCGSIS